MVSGPDLVGTSLVGLHAATNPGRSLGVEDYTSLAVTKTRTSTQPQSRMKGWPTPSSHRLVFPGRSAGSRSGRHREVGQKEDKGPPGSLEVV